MPALAYYQPVFYEGSKEGRILPSADRPAQLRAHLAELLRVTTGLYGFRLYGVTSAGKPGRAAGTITRNEVIPNPATPQGLRPVSLITDRAKRYRANSSPPPGPELCAICAADENLDIDHIDGDEANGAQTNLQYLCRSCNTRKGIIQRNAGLGKRTRQYNPEPKRRPPTFRQYVDAALILRGDTKATPAAIRKAAAVMQATPPAHRARFMTRIAAARNPEPGTPTYAQYAYAVSIHQRGSHDEGGKIIHMTPAADRSRYAKQFAAAKRRKGR